MFVIIGRYPKNYMLSGDNSHYLRINLNINPLSPFPPIDRTLNFYHAFWNNRSTVNKLPSPFTFSKQWAYLLTLTEIILLTMLPYLKGVCLLSPATGHLEGVTGIYKGSLTPWAMNQTSSYRNITFLHYPLFPLLPIPVFSWGFSHIHHFLFHFSSWITLWLKRPTSPAFTAPYIALEKLIPIDTVCYSKILLFQDCSASSISNS